MKAVRILMIAASLMATDELRCLSLVSLAHADQPIGVMNESNLIGKIVKNREGQNLGTMITNGRGSGDIKYAVLSLEGSFGAKQFAVPWSVLTLSRDKSHFVLNAKEAWMRNTGGFDKHGGLDVSQPDWAVVVYDVYHLHPKASRKTVHWNSSAQTSSVVPGETQGSMVRPRS